MTNSNVQDKVSKESKAAGEWDRLGKVIVSSNGINDSTDHDQPL
jgi:hypothetical protein